MKSIKTNILIFSLAASILALVGCHDPIFYDINQEVELNSSQIDGDVHSMARFGNYLITQNGYVWYKSASSSTNGEWKKMAAIPDGGTVWKIATDESHIYAISKVYAEDTDSSSDYEGELIQKSSNVYVANDVDDTWTAIDTSVESAYYPTVIFCTDSTTAANRHAFLRMSSGKVYELSGSTPLSSAYTDSTGTLTTSSIAAAYCGSNVYFSDYPAIASDGTTLYWTEGSDTIYYGTSKTATGSKDVDCSDILSIAITSDKLFLGTKTGAYHVSRNTDGSITSEASSSFDTNARSVLSSYYYIWLVFALDPTATENANALYASTVYKGSAGASASYWKNQCLWSYYPSRGNWNCE